MALPRWASALFSSGLSYIYSSVTKAGTPDVLAESTVIFPQNPTHTILNTKALPNGSIITIEGIPGDKAPMLVIHTKQAIKSYELKDHQVNLTVSPKNFITYTPYKNSYLPRSATLWEEGQPVKNFFIHHNTRKIVSTANGHYLILSRNRNPGAMLCLMEAKNPAKVIHQRRSDVILNMVALPLENKFLVQTPFQCEIWDIKDNKLKRTGFLNISKINLAEGPCVWLNSMLSVHNNTEILCLNKNILIRWYLDVLNNAIVFAGSANLKAADYTYFVTIPNSPYFITLDNYISPYSYTLYDMSAFPELQIVGNGSIECHSPQLTFINVGECIAKSGEIIKFNLLNEALQLSVDTSKLLAEVTQMPIKAQGITLEYLSFFKNLPIASSSQILRPKQRH